MISKFEQIGHNKKEIEEKLNGYFNTVFFGNPNEKFYFENEDGTGYLMDTGNDDVRTEGMSYGMMIALQLNKKEIFDRIWKWVYKYMLISDGNMKGYFKWSSQPNGISNAEGSAPDGEEFFAMTLLMAEQKWGNGTNELNYGQQARTLLNYMVHKGEDGNGYPMFDPKTTYIKFVAEMDISDPSYHLPHFYEFFAKNGNEKDREFFKKAADESRKYLIKTMDPNTGMAPEYSNYDGTPSHFRGHGYFYSDAYRVSANIGLDFLFTNNTDYPELKQRVNALQEFYKDKIDLDVIPGYKIDGTPVKDEFTEDGQDLSFVKHPTALLSGLAQGSLINEGKTADFYIEKLWNHPLQTGKNRYYDNLLFLFAFMALGGYYKEN
jgi:oligosaccharide reducing-end xylanase